MAGGLLLLGVLLGLLQWLVLRRNVPNAAWIMAVDILAASSILLVGDTITNLGELIAGLFLPALVSGIGLLLLLRQPGASLRRRPAERRACQTECSQPDCQSRDRAGAAGAAVFCVHLGVCGRAG